MANHFGETLRRLRAEKCLSQQQVANRLHVTRSAVANWEIGHRLPNAAMISQIARVLNADAALLLAAADESHDAPNVLLVDDSPIALEGGLPVLREALPGANVVGLASPAEAVRYFKSNPVALALLDIKIGRTNGLDLCQELLHIRPNANIAYITAYPEYSLDAWNTDACGFILKPLEVEAVRKLIPKLRRPVRGLL
ncbi:MAG: response regulator [Eggerthellaceae bacterium]|nr:response regulator [Eggerthellaceae bacterium]MBQ6390616.1 response regulator [Eggerthellaceae bacterium]MBQ9004683.1 response regulator [Eggerthellaceae bacterium]